jgi:tetratricopeptide (TPR) repeat protein
MSKSSPITAQQWSQAQRLLDELELLPEGRRRAALDAREVRDPRVRTEVESLLAAESERGNFMNESPWSDRTCHGPAPALPAGTILGAFRVEELIGRGGMAEVYRAQRIEEFEQRVAIKLISGDAAPQLDAFQRERRILAALEHPGISRIVDGGITEGGRPYMVMEYVEGTDLIRHAQAQRLDLAARLRLFRQVCEAVAFAHRLLVIHRDLKPGNIRVTPDGQVKLLDFGVAKLVEPQGRTEDFETATIMTPEFAAPEQLYGQPVTTATDVYALGAVLFHLLCGAPPFRTDGKAMHLVIDQRLRSEMPQLSATAAAQADPPIPPRLLRGDLDAIVARATRRKPADRYGSVDELSADVARHLAHQPVVARRGSTAYEIGRLLRRHRVAVAASAAVVLAVVVGMVGTLWQARAARHAESEALAQADRARRTKAFFVEALARAVTADRFAGAIDDALRRIDGLHDDLRLQAELLSDFGEIRAGQGDLESARALFSRALALHEEMRSPEDPTLATLLEARGSIEAALGRGGGALPFLNRALVIRERHPDQAEALAGSLMRIASVEQGLGKTPEAHRQLDHALAVALACGADCTSITRSIRLEKAVLDLADGDVLRADAGLEAAVAGTASVAPDDAVVLEAYRLLASSRREQGRLEEARASTATGLKRCADAATATCDRLRTMDMALAAAQSAKAVDAAVVPGPQ